MLLANPAYSTHRVRLCVNNGGPVCNQFVPHPKSKLESLLNQFNEPYYTKD